MKRQTLLKSTLCLLMALLCNVAWAQTPSLELSLLSKFAGATWYNAAGAVATSGWTNKLVTTNTSPAITLQAPEGKNVLGWYTKTSGRWPALQAGNVYTITIPEGYGFTGYTLTTQATTSGNKSTFTYTTAEGQVESVTQQTSDSKVTVTGLELISTITIDLTNYNVSSTSGIAISGLDVTYSPKSMHEVTGLELMSYPYALSDADANKIFASENLTIVADVTTASSMSGRGAIVSGSDPTKPKCTSATKTNSPYFAYGHNGGNPSYLASSLDGDRFGNNNVTFGGNKTCRVAIVANRAGNSYKLYIDGVEKHSITFPTDSYAFQTFGQFAGNEDAKVYIGGGVTSSGVQDIFDGTIHAVRFYGAALSEAEIAALGNEVTKSTTAKVYIAADARQADGSYAKHYLYNNDGTLATMPYYAPCEDKFTWTATRDEDGSYSFENGTGKKLGFNTTSNLCIADEAVSFTICPTNSVHAGSRGLLRIGSDDQGKWMLTKADGSAFNRQGSKVNNGTWTSDYVFDPYVENERMLRINTNISVDATATYNGETKPLPATFYVTGDVADENATVVITSNDKTKGLTHFTDALDDEHATLKLTSLAENTVYTAHFDFGLTDGAKYYIYAYTQPTSGNYVNRYLYKTLSGDVATSVDLVELFDNYMWTVTKDGEGYKLTNAAGGSLRYNSTNRFYLDNTIGDAFKVDPTNVATRGKVSIVSGTNVYVATNANGQSFNQHTNAQVNSTSWTTDYMFVPVEEPENEYIINFITSSSSAAEATVTLNGEIKPLPASFRVEKTTANAAVSVAIGNEDYSFTGLYEYGDDENLGVTYEFVPQSHKHFAVEYSFNLIAANYEDAVPVQIYNDNSNSNVIKLNATADYAGKAVNSGTLAYKENELWYLVGTETSFKMYSRTAGNTYAVKVAGTEAGSAATMVAEAEATPLQLKPMADGSYRIAPASSTNANVSFNMYGGAGSDIKLHDGLESEWRFRRMPENPLTINIAVEGEQPLPTNTRVAELSYNNSASHIITKETQNITMYVPLGNVVLSHPFLYRGYNFDGFYDAEGTETIDFNDMTFPNEGLTVTAKYSVDADNDYQYLYWYRSEDINAPYRIPAITVTKSGKVLAISDYRTCGDDIGMGEVDIMFRRSTESYDNWDKKSWTTEDFVADGQGGNENVFNVGFGDAAVVSDRESNKTLVMAVAGKQRFNWASATSHNSVARIVTDDDGDTWEITDLTDKFFGDENVLFPGFYAGFITSGRILQSSTYKAPGAQYYRIYGVAATNDDGNSSYPNYALYSDDFGATWKILGGSLEKGMCCDAGNETTIEELPNGDLVVSVRKSGGRYFNIFNYGTGEDDKANGIGEWEIKAGDTKVTSNFGSADCNGELLRVGNVLLHSHPKRGYQGKDRSNVAIFYKVLDPEKDYTAAEIATGWQELTQVSFIGSAYSTMTLLPDGKTVGFLYEEDPDNGTFAYCIVYKPIDLTKLLTPEAQKEAFVVNSTIGQYEIGTFYANDAMVVPEGVTAYVATAEPVMDETDAQGNAIGTITMTKVEDGIIPAHTGVLICGEPGTYAFKMADTEGETDVTNSLMPGYAGIYEHTDVALESGYITYVLTVKNEVAGFYKKASAFKVYNNKAYLQVPAAVSANALRIRFASTTEIETPMANDQQPTTIYDLQGRRVENPTKGIYIVDGKKVIVK